jgi:hypothetical protein
MATTSEFFAEIYVRRFLAPAAQGFGITVTPEMEADAVRRVQAWSSDQLHDDPKNPEDAEPGEWETA